MGGWDGMADGEDHLADGGGVCGYVCAYGEEHVADGELGEDW